MTTGDKIRLYREQQRMGQAKLAELSKLSVSAIRKYEANERFPKEDHLERIALALHVSVHSLRDIHFDSITDVLPYLFEISKWSGITFEGPTDSDGKHIPKDLSVRFKNEEVLNFLAKWADMRNDRDALLKSSKLVTDATTRDYMIKKAHSIDIEIEQGLVANTISENIFTQFELPSFFTEEQLQEDKYKPLKTYLDYLCMLDSLARSGIKWECVGISERFWEPKAIFTFEADSINTIDPASHDFKFFMHFIKFFNELAAFGVETESFAFQQGPLRYYRYTIKDRYIATGLDLINNIRKELEEGFVSPLMIAPEPTDYDIEALKYNVPVGSKFVRKYL